MHDRSAWTAGTEGPKRIGKKTYRNLVEFSRPCATCNKPFSIMVTRKIADGLADSNNFGLKNCEEHRRSSTRTTDETDALRSQVNVMKAELDGLYATVADLRGRLAQYELQPAMQAVVNGSSFPWTS